MSFEKLREIMLVIGIGLFLTVALIIAFISTLNARKGGQTIIAVQDVLVKGFQKSDTVRNQSTIATFAEDLKDRQVGDLKIDNTEMYVLNTDGDTDVQSGTINVAFPANLTLANTETKSKLRIAFIPSTAIKHDATKPANTTLGAGTFSVVDAAVSNKADYKNYNEGLRGFMSSGYMSFWGFANEATAKSYRDKFFPAGIVVKDKATATMYGIALEMAVN